jgi:FKBP-type peptidyl-prolyl cis-trans isomerase
MRIFLLGNIVTWLPVVAAWINAAQPVHVDDGRRRLFFRGAFVAAGVIVVPSLPAQALVKGVAPPPPKKSGDTPKCTNVEECQALAEKREQELREKEEQGPPPKVTPGGVRYRDTEDGSGDEVKVGDTVQVYFKVLKLGKRSYDGLSGEGTVVFSRGYGLEDDEKAPGDKSFITTVGNMNNIAALNEALVGMKVGSLRRFSILPDKGWRKPEKFCDGGPGGSGRGGDLRTDYVVVPTATMVEQEACFDQTRQPFPATYAQQRRMAQRFDQSLIMEVQVAKIN